MNILEERKNIEKRMLHKIIRNKKSDDVKIYNLERGYNNKLLGFSPHRLNIDTNKEQNIFTSYKYSNLSYKIHKQDSKRKDIEKEIYKLIPYNTKYIHLSYNEWLLSYDSFKLFCDRKGLPVLCRVGYRKLVKLIKQWKNESGKFHYKLKKHEKRKLKKLFDKNN